MSESKELSNILVSEVLFGQEAVKSLRESDFNLESDESITIKYKECMIVLFYTQNTESIQLASIWAEIGRQVAGPIFSAVNLLRERRVAEAFTNLNFTDNPYRWASLKQQPFILSYRGGRPQAFYNGDRSVQAITDWALTLACTMGYEEHIQIPAGMQVENNYQMDKWKEYDPQRTNSAEYTTATPVRGYNPSLPVTLVGSGAAAKEVQTEGTEAEAVATGRETPGQEQAGVTPTEAGAEEREALAIPATQTPTNTQTVSRPTQSAPSQTVSSQNVPTVSAVRTTQ